MPKVPEKQVAQIGAGHGPSPLSQVTPENLLMAAVTMQDQGRFSIPSAKSTKPNPIQKHAMRKLKVVK